MLSIKKKHKGINRKLNEITNNNNNNNKGGDKIVKDSEQQMK